MGYFSIVNFKCWGFKILFFCYSECLGFKSYVLIIIYWVCILGFTI